MSAAPSTLHAFDAALAKLLVGSAPPHANLFFSPYSVASALELLWAAADAGVRKEIVSALGLSALGSNYAAIVRGLKAQRDALQASDSAVSMLVAMAAFVRGDVPAAVRSRLHADLDAEIAPLTSADAINAWCARNTHDEITKLVDRLDDSMVAMLLNAIYFKGAWTQRFDKADTNEAAEFTTAAGGVVRCAMMSHSDAELGVCRAAHGYVLRLEYGASREFAMLLSLPDTSVDAALDELVGGWARMRIEEAESVTALVPRFELESTLDLVPPINALGMRSMFTSGHLTELSEDAYVSGILHKAVCRVDEEGTVAAAVTAIDVDDECESEPIVLQFNRPFAFVIVHYPSSTLMFAGRVCDPVVGRA